MELASRGLVSMALALAFAVSLIGCSAPPSAAAPAQATQPATPARRFVQADVRGLHVNTRHAESARIGDLAGLLITIDNASGIDVPAVQIRLSNSYLNGLEIRRTEPAIVTRSADGPDQIFLFPGPETGAKATYVLTLTPVREGVHPGELAVSVLDDSKRELPVAIYEVKTTVGPDRFTP